jgi:hypothetical protein
MHGQVRAWKEACRKASESAELYTERSNVVACRIIYSCYSDFKLTG